MSDKKCTLNKMKKWKENSYKGIGDFPRSDSWSQGVTGLELLKLLIEGLIEAILVIITSLGYFSCR